MGYFAPTEKQEEQAEKATDQANLVIGRFVLAWSRVEMHLRTLELMHEGDYRFRPVRDLESIDLHKKRRFRDRVNLVVPKELNGQRFEVRDWLLQTQKIRNLVIHGFMIFQGAGDSGVVTPAIIHSDFIATGAATEGFPNISTVQAPTHRHSLSPDALIDVSRLNVLIEEAKQIEDILLKLIDSVHREPSQPE